MSARESRDVSGRLDRTLRGSLANCGTDEGINRGSFLAVFGK